MKLLKILCGVSVFVFFVLCLNAQGISDSELRLNSNGTATVLGIVGSNRIQSNRDGNDYLWVMTDSGAAIEVEYSPAEGERSVPADLDGKSLQKIQQVKRGMKVEVYGAYRKLHSADGTKSQDFIEVWSSKNYYVRVIPSN